jgi:hypothetical protein
MIRDTLEYVQNRPTYDPDFYSRRKTIIEHGMEDNAPLMHFLRQNGEVGEQIKTNINNFMDFLFSDSTTYVTVENGKLSVDHAQDLTALDYVVGLRETLVDIIKRFIEQAEKDGQDVAEMKTVVALDDAFYRVLASLIIFDKTHASFLEFNKAVAENKGQPSPQSNFVINDMKKLVGYTKFVNEHSDKGDTEYQKLYEDNFTVLNYMEGSKPLPNDSGMKGEIDKVHNAYIQTLGPREALWRQAYNTLWNQLVGYEQAMNVARAQQNKEENK